MLPTALICGLIAGLVAAIPQTLMAMAMRGRQPMLDYSTVLGYLTMLIALSVVFVAIKRRRDRDLGGVIRFWPALGLGVGISLVAGIVYVVSWELAQYFFSMDFARNYGWAMIEQQRAKGASPEALEKVIIDMEYFARELYPNPLWRLPMTFAEIFPVGLLVSLVSAGLLRNPRVLPAQG
jgi:hypothetical protein